MIAVRRIRPDEARVLRAVRLAALADTPAAFGSTLERELAFDDTDWTDRAIGGSAGDQRCTFLAWHDDGRVVGIVGGYRLDPAEGAPTSQAVDLVSMWTDPAVRRAGIGAALVDAVIDWARAGGAARVELWVTRGNDPAQRLYESMGFVVTGDHQPLPSDPCKDEIRMVLTLS
ncbi:MAG: GNAT family N-acetyltransferase [Actinobacteria bacterium]|nr:GNAT family N-acetyltransferase [Actinomycetota bacterium]